MATPMKLPFYPSSLSLTIVLLLTIITPLLSYSHFTPTDNYLVNCGSSSPSTLDPDNRIFTSDSVYLDSTRTSQITSNSVDTSSHLYGSTRVFTKPSTYTFSIKESGPHLVRLHFSRFNSSAFDLYHAKFHVIANEYLLIYDFDGLKMENNVVFKEFILWVSDNKLEISFIPVKRSNFGFINAIEVVSAPKDLILDRAHMVDFNGVVKKIDGVLRNGFETMHRVTVGGPKVTPFNDSMWRTWVTDDGFIEANGGGGSNAVHFSGKILYVQGGVSREVAPDNVYSSARVIRGGSKSLGVAKENLSWAFRVLDGCNYLVRTHFCDIASDAFGELYFNVYVNGYLVYENVDPSMFVNGLASPFYADFVVDGGKDGVIRVSVGPSNWSSASGVDAILNGIEIFKLNNSMNSFDGMVSPTLILRKCHRGSGALLTLLAAAIGLLVAASVVLRKRFMSMRDSVTWSRLPLDVSEVNLKSSYR